MRKIVVLVGAIFIAFGAFAQTKISGTITDANTGEALIGATVIYGKGMGTATDFEGNYSFSIWLKCNKGQTLIYDEFRLFIIELADKK